MKKYKFNYKNTVLEFDRVDLKDAIKAHIKDRMGRQSLTTTLYELCGYPSIDVVESLCISVLLDNGELVEYIADHCADTALTVDNVRSAAQQEAIDAYECKQDEQQSLACGER